MYGVGGSQPIPKDASLSFSFNNLKPPDPESMKIREFMSSDLYQQQQHNSGGLTRYRSAPSSFFASLVDGCEEGFLSPPHRSPSPESESMFARFMPSNGSAGESESHDPQFPTALRRETPTEQHRYSSTCTSTFVGHRDSADRSSGSNLDGYCKQVANGAGMENLINPVLGKTSSGNGSNLVRQSSSPSWFLSNLTAENEFAVNTDMGNFGVGNGTNGKASRLNDHSINFSTGSSSRSRFMPRINENGNECISKNGHLGNVNGSSEFLEPSFQNDSWNDPRFTGLKRIKDGDATESQNGDSRNCTTGLTHHLSFRKTPTLVAVEKVLQDSVPCKIRAKRGFATHPRSIAERERRTRISEKMRKIQELFPNMDKQTSTADMLDLAVEYIKELQKQLQTLTDDRAKCMCLSKKKQCSKPHP